ncbi:unnamed protein product [Medioppia subpectinata]|uniref:Uncharacterized protein n=1 Tax=Medioppia subpectinata TaxID=1979941 RepID=A0A7R9Q0T7_9ACAR|nr:unnamed protein product [Medioppia subpectinata]CAG2107877.1 unnamed protein product [Medioppia subpectinata]
MHYFLPLPPRNDIPNTPFGVSNDSTLFCPQDLRNESDFDRLNNFDPTLFDFSQCNFSDPDHPIWYRRPDWDVAVKTLAILPVMIVGVFGNLAVIALIVKLYTLRKSIINLFILNMAIADLLTTVYIAICYPQRCHLNRKQSYIITTAIWAIAITLASPLAYWRVYKERQWLDVNEKWCPEDHTNVSKYYWLFLMLPLVYIPLIVVTIIYTVIIRRLDRLARALADRASDVPTKLRHRQILMKMLLTYIITTIICWFPLQVLVYYRRFHIESDIFASANSAINPVVTFRKSFAHLLPKLFANASHGHRVGPQGVIRRQLDIPVIAWDGGGGGYRGLEIKGWDGSPDITPKGLKSDPFPPRTNTDLLRVYSNQICPYAERALLVLAAKDIKHEIINVNLRDKVEWWVKQNPLGKVPTIEFGADNKVLYESLIVAEYLDEVYTEGRPLQPRDAYQRASDRVFIETFSVNFSAYYKYVYGTDDLAAVWPDIVEVLKKVDTLLAKRRANNRYLSGESLPGLVDYAIWPFIERLPQIIDLAGHNSTDYLAKELPTVHDYSQQLLADPSVQKVLVPYEKLLAFTRESRKTLLKK